MALIGLVDNISSNMDHKKYNIAVFLDLSKAFDTIDHNILIHKCQCYGLRGNDYNWFKSYLNSTRIYIRPITLHFIYK